MAPRLSKEDAQYLNGLPSQGGQEREARPMEEQPIRFGPAVKIIGMLSAVVIYSVTVFAYVESIRHGLEMEVQKQQIAHTQIDKELDALIAGQEAGREANQRLSESIIRLTESQNRQNAILDIIAKQMQQPKQ